MIILKICYELPFWRCKHLVSHSGADRLVAVILPLKCSWSSSTEDLEKYHSPRRIEDHLPRAAIIALK